MPTVATVSLLLCWMAWPLLLIRHLRAIDPDPSRRRRRVLRVLELVTVVASLVYFLGAQAWVACHSSVRDWLVTAEVKEKLAAVKYAALAITLFSGLLSSVSETRAEPRGLTKLGWVLVVILLLGSGVSAFSQYLETVADHEKEREEAKQWSATLANASEFSKGLGLQRASLHELQRALAEAVDTLDGVATRQERTLQSLDRATAAIKNVEGSAYGVPEAFLLRQEVRLPKVPPEEDLVSSPLHRRPQARRPREALRHAGLGEEVIHRLLKQSVQIRAGGVNWSLRSNDLLQTDTTMRAANSLHEPGVFFPRSGIAEIVLELNGQVDVPPDVRSRMALVGKTLTIRFSNLAPNVRIASLAAAMPRGQGFGEIPFTDCADGGANECRVVLGAWMLNIPAHARSLLATNELLSTQ